MLSLKMATQTRNQVLELMNKKEKIEQEIKELGSILAQNGIGMTEPLVDSEGYPLSNIDVYQVRFARNKIICLQNDHKMIMKQIEAGLGQYYESNSSANNEPIQNVSTSNSSSFRLLQPFAKISNISAGSPADEAGLQNDDLLVEFGSINFENFNEMSVLADIVRHSENGDIIIGIQRSSHNLKLKLRPRKWHGRGLLGCLITPLESIDR